MYAKGHYRTDYEFPDEMPKIGVAMLQIYIRRTFLVITGLLTILLFLNISPALVKAEDTPTSGPATMVMYYPPAVYESYSDISINGGGLVAGWCADKYVYIIPGRPYEVLLIDYFGYPPIMQFPNPGTYPPYIERIRWDCIAYILNHKQGTADDVQQSFWYFSDSLTPSSTIAQAIVADALANGPGFIPGAGQIRPIICDLGSQTQLTFFEMKNPDPPISNPPGDKPKDISVGIDVYRVNKMELIFPWLFAGSALVSVTGVGLLVRRQLICMERDDEA